MKKLIWLPIDIPKFPISDFNLKTDFSWKYWNFARLSESRDSSYSETILKGNLDSRLYDWFAYFPFKNIRNIKFNIQKDIVREHIDFTSPDNDKQLFENNSINEPCGYRILIRGSRQGKLYVYKNEQKHYTVMPEDTDVYVLRHTDGLHGVDLEPNRTTIFTHFEIDSVKHRDLIEKSLYKYKDYAIYE